jgi:hypothetical protein
VFASLAEQVAAAEKRMETLRAEDLPALEKLLAASGVGPIVYPP